MSRTGLAVVETALELLVITIVTVLLWLVRPPWFPDWSFLVFILVLSFVGGLATPLGWLERLLRRLGWLEDDGRS